MCQRNTQHIISRYDLGIFWSNHENLQKYDENLHRMLLLAYFCKFLQYDFNLTRMSSKFNRNVMRIFWGSQSISPDLLLKSPPL